VCVCVSSLSATSHSLHSVSVSYLSFLLCISLEEQSTQHPATHAIHQQLLLGGVVGVRTLYGDVEELAQAAGGGGALVSSAL
jgi:hypothetical protein